MLTCPTNYSIHNAQEYSPRAFNTKHISAANSYKPLENCVAYGCSEADVTATGINPDNPMAAPQRNYRTFVIFTSSSSPSHLDTRLSESGAHVVGVRNSGQPHAPMVTRAVPARRAARCRCQAWTRGQGASPQRSPRHTVESETSLHISTNLCLPPHEIHQSLLMDSIQDL